MSAEANVVQADPPHHCVVEERGYPVDQDLPASTSPVLVLQVSLHLMRDSIHFLKLTDERT